MVNRIAVIGDSESIKGFSAVGLDIYACEETEQSNAVLKKIASNAQYSVIYMTEETFCASEKERKHFEKKITPAIIPIPGVKGNNGTGKKRLSAFVEKAVGSDILFNN
jgi:V/A-type H+-transporting ATPase subunit F